MSDSDGRLLLEMELAATKCWQCHRYGHRGIECPEVCRQVERQAPGKFVVVETRLPLWAVAFWILWGALMAVCGRALWGTYRVARH